MRNLLRLGLIGLLGIAAQSAQASIINWNIGGTLDSVRTLGRFGSPEVGSPFSVQATIDTATPGQPTSETDGYFGLFQSFTLSIGDTVLTLNPTPTDSDPTKVNFFTVWRYTTFEQLSFAANLTDGTNEYTTEFLLNFSDPDAYALHDLSAPLPSLATKFDRFNGTTPEFSIFYPSTGGYTFLASGTVNALDSTEPASVPEPGVIALLGAGIVALGLARRRRELLA